MSRPSWDATWAAVALAVAKRSLCSRAQVGAVIVDTRNRIVSSGYNNPPAGFAHEDLPCTEWCDRARPSRVYSPDETDVQMRTEVYWSQGAGKVLAAERVAAEMTAWDARRDPTYQDCCSIHAELNCVLAADRSAWQGGTIYVTSDVCTGCAKAIANSGLARVVVQRDGVDRSYRTAETGYDLLRACGLELTIIEAS